MEEGAQLGCRSAPGEETAVKRRKTDEDGEVQRSSKHTKAHSPNSTAAGTSETICLFEFLQALRSMTRRLLICCWSSRIWVLLLGK